MKFFMKKKMIALCGAAAMILPLAACGTTQAGTTDEQGKTVVNVWAWDNNLKANAKVFMKKNPNIVIKFTNAGSGKDEYQALNNALEAGSGVPDIAMIEYYAIPEYAIKGSLKNLNDYGTAKYKDFYTPGTWNAVNFNGGMYGMPVDSGPMAFYYNKEVFDKAGISEAPKNLGRILPRCKKDQTNWLIYHQRPRKCRILQRDGLAGRRPSIFHV